MPWSHLFAGLGKVHTGFQVVRILLQHPLVIKCAQLDLPHADLAEPEECPRLHSTDHRTRPGITKVYPPGLTHVK